MAGRGGLTEALVLQIGFALLSRACQTRDQCSYTFTLQGKLGDAQWPEAPQQWKGLQPGEETPKNGTVAGKRGSDLLLKSSSITAFVHGLRNFAKSCGSRLEPLQPDEQHSRDKQSHHSLLPTHSSPVVPTAYPAAPVPAPRFLTSAIKSTFSEQWEETRAQNVTLAVLPAVLV